MTVAVTRRAAPIAMTRSEPMRSASHPMSGLAPYMPRMWMLITMPTSESDRPCSTMCTGVMTMTTTMTVCEHTIARIATREVGLRAAVRSARHAPMRFGGCAGAAAVATATRSGVIPAASASASAVRAGTGRGSQAPPTRARGHPSRGDRPSGCAAGCRRGSRRARTPRPRTGTAPRGAAGRVSGRGRRPPARAGGRPPTRWSSPRARATSSGPRSPERRSRSRRSAPAVRRPRPRRTPRARGIRAPAIRSSPRRSRARRRETHTRSPSRGRRAARTARRDVRAEWRRRAAPSTLDDCARPPIAVTSVRSATRIAASAMPEATPTPARSWLTMSTASESPRRDIGSPDRGNTRSAVLGRGREEEELLERRDAGVVHLGREVGADVAEVPRLERVTGDGGLVGGIAQDVPEPPCVVAQPDALGRLGRGTRSASTHPTAGRCRSRVRSGAR